MEFILPRLSDTCNGGFNFAHQTAQLNAHTGTLANQDEHEGFVLSIQDVKVRWTHVVPRAVETSLYTE